MPLVETIHCQDADNFFDLLSPRGSLFGGTEAVGSNPDRGDGWIYRGHADDDYLLTPSALRHKGSFLELGGPQCADHETQVVTETTMILRFFNLADATGLPLPEDSQALRKNFAEVRSESYLKKIKAGKEIWPPRALWSLLGIGQHYGIPTRLLDWSRKAFVAGYFAAEGAAARLTEAEEKRSKKIDDLKEKRLSVWAFAYDRFASRFDKDFASYFEEPAPPNVPLVKVTAPHAHNPNLHAQDGLFTLELQNLKSKLNQAVDRRPLDQVVREFLTAHTKSAEANLYFRRITLNWGHAPHALWRLLQEGISSATIYPGYSGVVDAMKAEARYGH